MTEQDPAEALSIGDVANQAEHKQQSYESNKRLKKSLQAVSSDKGMWIDLPDLGSSQQKQLCAAAYTKETRTAGITVHASGQEIFVDVLQTLHQNQLATLAA